jgi:spermidine/putrescine transport system ATP-binding protein
VTHDQEEALTMSDRIAVMNHGVIEQVDGPENVYERPRTTFVAGFIGVSNLMPAEIASGGELRLDAGISVPLDNNGVKPGERLHCVVRPEKLELHPQSDPLPADHPAVKGVVESSLYLGTATQAVVRLHDATAMTVLIPNADEEARQRLPAPGAPVWLGWSREHMHIVREAVGDMTTEEGEQGNE